MGEREGGVLRVWPPDCSAMYMEVGEVKRREEERGRGEGGGGREGGWWDRWVRNRRGGGGRGGDKEKRRVRSEGGKGFHVVFETIMLNNVWQEIVGEIFPLFCHQLEAAKFYRHIFW